MTTITYQPSRRITYTVCAVCFGYALTATHLAQHSCDRRRDWPRFIRDCKCSSCTKFRSWHDQEQGIG